MGAETLEALVEKATAGLDRSYFTKVLPQRNLTRAFLLAQEEDFTAADSELISPAMFALLDRDAVVSHPHNKNLLALDTAIRALPNPLDRRLALGLFRTAFLEKLGDFFRYRNTLKRRWQLSIFDNLQFDSNVNRTPEGNPGPAKHSGKDDIQDAMGLSFTWKPLANDAAFNRKWDFRQVTNAVRTLQSEVKANEVLILDTESQLNRRLGFYGLDSLRLGYRIRHFISSNLPTTDEFVSSFRTHRFKTDWNFVPHTFKGGGRLHSTATEVSVSIEDKNHFRESDHVRNAFIFDSEVTQTFYYRVGRRLNSLAPSLEYSSYITDGSASSNYTLVKGALDHRHQYTWSAIKQVFTFSEEASWRLKNWSHYFSGEQDEDLLQFQARASTMLAERLLSSISLAQVWKDNEITPSGASTKARQFQITFGLNWSTP